VRAATGIWPGHCSCSRRREVPSAATQYGLEVCSASGAAARAGGAVWVGGLNGIRLALAGAVAMLVVARSSPACRGTQTSGRRIAGGAVAASARVMTSRQRILLDQSSAPVTRSSSGCHDDAPSPATPASRCAGGGRCRWSDRPVMNAATAASRRRRRGQPIPTSATHPNPRRLRLGQPRPDALPDLSPYCSPRSGTSGASSSCSVAGQIP